MDVDLQQLPIPDWGLQCPQCEYPLYGLPTHRCPECGTIIDVASLIRTWTRLRDPLFTGHELPIPEYGMLCSACGCTLDNSPTLACRGCGRDVSDQLTPPKTPWFRVHSSICRRFTIPQVGMLLEAELIPFLLSDERSVIEIHAGGAAIGGRLSVPSEFYFDLLWLLERERRKNEAAPARGAHAAWDCQACGEHNPANFDICWNCGTACET